MTSEQRQETAGAIDYLVPSVGKMMELTPSKENIESVNRIIGTMLVKIEMLVQDLD